MSESSTVPPAGWHPDPWGSHRLRYWDGASWTNAVSDGAFGSADPSREGQNPMGTGAQHFRHDANDAKRTASSKKGFFDFWTTLPGVFTAIAAVVTAVGSVFIATRSDNGGHGPLSNPSPIAVVANDVGASDIVGPGPDYGDYATVRDATSTVVVNVPVDWNIDDSPIELDDGTELPTVTASPDLAGYVETFDVSGVQVSATDMSVTDVPTAMDDLAPSECLTLGTEPYEDPAFEGEIEFFECNGGTAVYMLLAAHYKPDPARIAVVEGVITTDADFDVVTRALETFNFT